MKTPKPRNTQVFKTWSDYLIPGTDVLRNKLTSPDKPYGETDPDKLREYEETATRIRAQRLYTNPLPGHFDYPHMKAIHHYLFQDVYEWAGEERVGPSDFMTKNGYSYYAAGPALTKDAEKHYRILAEKNLLRGLDESTFVNELAETWGEINVIHSFREGNTRSQFVFFTQLSEQAGYQLNPEVFAPEQPLREQFVKARFHGQKTGRNDLLAEVLSQAITPTQQAPIVPYKRVSPQDFLTAKKNLDARLAQLDQAQSEPDPHYEAILHQVGD